MSTDYKFHYVVSSVILLIPLSWIQQKTKKTKTDMPLIDAIFKLCSFQPTQYLWQCLKMYLSLGNWKCLLWNLDLSSTCLINYRMNYTTFNSTESPIKSCIYYQITNFSKKDKELKHYHNKKITPLLLTINYKLHVPQCR